MSISQMAISSGRPGRSCVRPAALAASAMVALDPCEERRTVGEEERSVGHPSSRGYNKHTCGWPRLGWAVSYAL